MTSDDLNGELAALRETVTAGFARADRYYELQQVPFTEFREEVMVRFDSVTVRLDALSARLDALAARVGRVEGEVQSLRGEFDTFRDLVTREFAEVHAELRELRQVGAAQSARIEQLSARVDLLEHRWNGLGGAQTGSTT